MPERLNIPPGDGLNAVAVVGSEPVATASAALDFARAEARHRRVTVVDLIGDAPPLRAVAITDDPHGVADSFEYGISFGAIVRPTTVHPNVSVLPSGSEPLPFADALPSGRWDRLIAEARRNGDVLVFAILSGTPSLSALTARMDCVVAAPSRLREVLEGAPSPTASGLTPRIRSLWRMRLERAPATASGGRWQATGLAAASLVLLAGLGWLITRRQAAPPSATSGIATPGPDRAAGRADTVTSTAQLAPGAAGTASAVPSKSGSVLEPVDPGDSTLAATYAVRIATFSTYADALRALRRHPARGLAGTVAPLGGDTLALATPAAPAEVPTAFVVLAGAARTRPALDSLAARWPWEAGSPPSSVVRAPLALRLAADVPADSALRLAAAWFARGVPAYALVTASGMGSVYAGAFDRADQTVPLAASLRAVGLAPVIAYRVGYAP